MTRESTLVNLRKAYLAVKFGRSTRARPNCKMSVQAVATEAGVTPALIYNRYPEVLALIRGSKPKAEGTSARNVGKDVPSTKQLREDLAKLASINARMAHELRDAQARLSEASEECARLRRMLDDERANATKARGSVLLLKPRN